MSKKKIIAAFDGLKFSESTKQYAIMLAQQSNAHLVGIFLDDFTVHSYSVYDLMQDESGISQERQKTLSEKDKTTRNESVKKFEEGCRQAKLEYSVHRDGSIAMQELLQESIYADLLVISQHETFSRFKGTRPTEFVRELLVSVQCPVLAVPARYRPVDRIVLLYDGEPASVYAIRTMSAVLGDIQGLPVDAVCVKSAGQNLRLPDTRLMKEFMKRHYPAAGYIVLKGDAEETITTYLKKTGASSLVVLGAYRRGMVSRWFRPSMADVLMRELKLPLFITHH
jgi:nucleotide-binding universal stress UspA family protein